MWINVIRTKSVRNENEEIVQCPRQRCIYLYILLYFVDPPPSLFSSCNIECEGAVSIPNSNRKRKTSISIPERLSNPDPLNIYSERKTTPGKRMRVPEKRFNNNVSRIQQNDAIKDYKHFKNELTSHINKDSPWVIQHIPPTTTTSTDQEKEDSETFLYSFDATSSIPKVISVINVKNDI